MKKFWKNRSSSSSSSEEPLVQSEEDAREDAWRYYLVVCKDKKYRRLLIDTMARAAVAEGAESKVLTEVKNEETELFLSRIKYAQKDDDNEKKLLTQEGIIAQKEYEIGANLDSMVDLGTGKGPESIANLAFSWIRI